MKGSPGEEIRSAAVWGKSLTGLQLVMEGPSEAGAVTVRVKQCLTGANGLRGANTTCHYHSGGLQSLRRETVERGNTYTHSRKTDGGTPTNTDQAPLCGVNSQTQAQTCTHCRDTEVGSYQCRALCTQRGCQLTLTHLYSVMIMQCHAGTDYVKVSGGKA